MITAIGGAGFEVRTSTELACETALAGFAGRTPIGVLAFNCIGRRGILGAAIGAEVELISIYQCT